MIKKEIMCVQNSKIIVTLMIHLKIIRSFGKDYKYLLTVVFQLSVVVLKEEILNCQFVAKNYKS